MTPERWQRIDSLFQEAIKRAPGDRRAYLDEVCDDADSRREIESLISFHEQAENFLEEPAFEAAAELFFEGQVESPVGLLVGTYRIEAQLGAGGMGEVYLAEDTRLDRKVAIKFLPAYLEADELARKRLVNEAKAAARLDHPNICSTYEVKEGSPTFIVMQYVEGETLAAKIARQALGLRDAVEAVVQVADALAQAHSHGVVHRDIKPQNIMITPRGQVKVLDFGLAKMLPPVALAEKEAKTETLLSAPGIIMGTAPYMSPEQAKGATVDARSDLFSLGAVLYECITGRAPFSGATLMEICAQVIHLDPPPPSEINPQVSPELDAVTFKALAKEPDARYQLAADMLAALRAALAGLRDNERAATGRETPKPTAAGIKSLTNKLPILRRPPVFIPAILLAVAIALAFFLRLAPWGRATPHQPSPEALRWYNAGINASRNAAYYDSSKALRQAIAADDKFALAHARLAEAYTELDYSDRANQEILRARSLAGDISMLPRLDGLYLQAITHVVLREFAPAIETYQEITREAPGAEKAQAYLDLGRAYEKNDEVDNAIASYIEAARLAPSDAAAYLRLGILYGRKLDLEAAREALQKAEELYQALSNLEGVTEVLFQRGFLLKTLDKIAESRAQLERALAITSTTENKYQQVRAMLILSSVLAAEGHASQAEEQAIQAIELAQAGGIENQATMGLIQLGNSFLARGEYGDAEKYYKQALDLARKDDGFANAVWALVQLGSVRQIQRDTDGALSYIEQVLPYYHQGGYRKYFSQALILMGRLYRDKGNYENSLGTFNELLKGSEGVGDQSLLAYSHEGIGSVLVLQELYPEALAHFEKSYQINKSLNARVNVGYACSSKGG